MSEEIARYNVLLELISETKGTNKVKEEMGGLEKSFNQARNAFIAVFAIEKVAAFGKELFAVTAKYQQYNTILSNSLGSTSKAANAMALIKDIATESVFSVDELTSSYIKFINRGLKPTREQLIAFTDIAASQGKGIDQLTEAVLDATTGEFERLKEFGIKANKEGDKIKLSFKGQAIEVANTSQAINDAIVGFGQLPGVLGSNAVQMDTLNGKISLIKDSFEDVLVKIGNGLLPVFNFLLSAVASLVAGLQTFGDVLIAIPKFVDENKTALKLLLVALLAFDLSLAKSNTLLILNAGLSKAKAVADVFLAKKTAIVTGAQNLFNAALKANPIGLVITAIFALGAGVAVLYDKFEAVRNVVAGLKEVALDFVKFIAEVPEKLAKVLTGQSSFEEEFGNLGKKARASFDKGFQENASKEAVKKAASALGGRASGSDLADKYREIRELDEKEKQDAADRRKREKEDALKAAEKAAAELEKRIKKELEEGEKPFLQQEIEAKKSIKNAEKLADTLADIEQAKQLELIRIEQKYRDERSKRGLELENKKLDLKGEGRERFTIELIPRLERKKEQTNFVGLYRDIKELNDKIAKTSDPRVRINLQVELAKKNEELTLSRLRLDVKELNEKIAKTDNLSIKADYIVDLQSAEAKLDLFLKSIKDKKAKFINGTDDSIGLLDLLPDDQVDALKKKIKVLKDQIANFHPKNITEKNVFQKMKEDLEAFEKTLKDFNGNSADSVDAAIEEALAKMREFTDRYQKYFNQIKGSLDSVIQNDIDRNDRAIEAQERRVEKAEKLAEKGNVKQLELEEDKLNKLHEKREKFAQAQRTLDQLQIASANAVAIAESIKAIAVAFGQPGGLITGIATSLALAAQIYAAISSVRTAFSDIPNFIGGIEEVGKDSRFNKFKVHNGQDGYTARFDGKERIVDPATNALLGGFPNAKLPAAVALYKLMPHLNTDKMMQGDTNMKKEIKGLRDEIKSLGDKFDNSRTSIVLDKNGLAIQIDKMIQGRIDRKRQTA